MKTSSFHSLHSFNWILQCNGQFWNVNVKMTSFYFFQSQANAYRRYHFNWFTLFVSIEENWLYRRRAPQIESTTLINYINSMIYSIPFNRVMFSFLSFSHSLFLSCLRTTNDNEVNWFAVHSCDRPHRSREILFDLFMLIESANDWIEM